MTFERKTPQQKKSLQYARDHFTCGESAHGFRKTWPRKKALWNREYRRKSDELLSQAKPGISADDAEIVAGEVTIAQLKKSVSRKRLHKWGPMTVGEGVKFKLEKRVERVGRRATKHRKYDAIVISAVGVLNSLERKKLVEAVKRIAVLLQGGDPVEWARLYQSTDSLDRAIFFVERLARRDSNYVDALRRNEKLCESFQRWKKKANRVFTKLRRPQERKIEQKVANEKRVKALRRENQRVTHP